MPVRHAEQMIPVQAFLNEVSEPVGCFSRPTGPRALEKKLGFRTSKLNRGQRLYSPRLNLSLSTAPVWAGVRGISAFLSYARELA